MNRLLFFKDEKLKFCHKSVEEKRKEALQPQCLLRVLRQITSANKLRSCRRAVTPKQRWPSDTANTHTHTNTQITNSHARMTPAVLYILLTYKHWAVVGPKQNNTWPIFCSVRPRVLCHCVQRWHKLNFVPNVLFYAKRGRLKDLLKKCKAFSFKVSPPPAFCLCPSLLTLESY